jgi:uncharacterized Zn finger protein
LIEILLAEQEVETARRGAEAGSCRDDLWLRLADLRATNHPEDALAIYQRQVKHWVEQTNNQAYEQAMTLVGKIGPLLRQQDGGAQRWSDYLAASRGQFKAKRNFIKLLNMLK